VSNRWDIGMQDTAVFYIQVRVMQFPRGQWEDDGNAFWRMDYCEEDNGLLLECRTGGT
jgi:hypothetical protein